MPFKAVQVLIIIIIIMIIIIIIIIIIITKPLFYHGKKYIQLGCFSSNRE